MSCSERRCFCFPLAEDTMQSTTTVSRAFDCLSCGTTLHKPPEEGQVPHMRADQKENKTFPKSFNNLQASSQSKTATPTNKQAASPSQKCDQKVTQRGTFSKKFCFARPLTSRGVQGGRWQLLQCIFKTQVSALRQLRFILSSLREPF